MRKIFLLIMFFILIISFSGCCTIQGTADGLAKDIETTWRKAEKIDAWLQKHAW